MTQDDPPKIDIQDIANRLWETADELRANSHLKGEVCAHHDSYRWVRHR